MLTINFKKELTHYSIHLPSVLFHEAIGCLRFQLGHQFTMDINISLVRNFLQSFTEKAESLQNQIDVLKGFLWVILIALLANIAITVIKFFLDKEHSKQEAKLQRRKLIFEQSLIIEKDIFKKVDALSDYTRNDCPRIIEDVNNIRDQLNENRLFFEYEVYKSIDDILNYFAEISGDFRKKNVNKEILLKKKYIEAFHG